MSSSPGISAPNVGSSSTKEVIHRLVRSMSGRSVTSNDARSTTTQVGSPLDSESRPLQRTESNTSLGSNTSKTKGKRRLSIENLKKLAKNVPIGKTRSSSGKGVLASPRITNGDIDNSSNNAEEFGHVKMLSMVAEFAEADESSSVATPSATSPNPVTNPSPDSLAKRLQDMIDALPFPDYRGHPIKVPKPPARDKTGRPIAPSSPISDPKLLSLLQSATYMNGGREHKKKSIWDVLEQVGIPPHAFPEDEDTNDGEGGDNGEETPKEPASDPNSPDIFLDNSSIMMYSPLIPGLDDLVELAELVPVGVDQEFLDEPKPSTWASVWPLSIIGKSKPSSQTPVFSLPSYVSGDVVYSPAITTIDELGRKVRVKTVRAWVPSTAKLSFQAMWWGYRLWLPPPVLSVLSDKTVEATKRAAMITAALTWFFNNLPIDALPIAVRPAALLMQRIVPYLGYIGSFISWSWATIKSYDVGYGVTLTSTWLLPIALIPGSWYKQDVPTSPTTSPPALPAPTGPSTTPPASPPESSTPAPTLPPATSPGPTEPSEPPTTIPSTPSTNPTPVTSPSTNPTTPETTPSDPSTLPPEAPHESKSPTSPTLFARKLFFSPKKVTSIPVPAEPIGPPPIPPTPSSIVFSTPGSPAPVAVGSPLSRELLHGPVIGTVPLPDEDSPVDETTSAETKATKSSSKHFFGRFGL